MGTVIIVNKNADYCKMKSTKLIISYKLFFVYLFEYSPVIQRMAR